MDNEGAVRIERILPAWMAPERIAHRSVRRRRSNAHG
jgi:hypothetical protein